MKVSQALFFSPVLTRLLGLVVGFFPVLLLAHPGHYHPDETDEFDFLRSTIFHSHGAADYLLGGVAIMCLLVSWLHGRRSVRWVAAILALASLVLLPVL